MGGGVPAVTCWPHLAACLHSPARQPTHWLTHCLSRGPGLSVHLLPQQLGVEDSGLTQVLVGCRGWL